MSSRRADQQKKAGVAMMDQNQGAGRTMNENTGINSQNKVREQGRAQTDKTAVEQEQKLTDYNKCEQNLNFDLIMQHRKCGDSYKLF